MTRYLIFLKNSVKNPSLWLILLLMVLSVIILGSVIVPEKNNRRVLLYGEDDYALGIIEELSNMDSYFSFKQAEDEESLHEEVRTGRAECGFIFSDDMERRMKEDNIEGMVSYISSPFTMEGLVARETVFAAIYEQYVPMLLKRESSHIFRDGDNGAEVTKTYYQSILDSDIIYRMEYEEYEGTENSVQNENRSALKPVHSIVAILIFAGAIFSSINDRFGRNRYFGGNFAPNERYRLQFLNASAANTIPSAVGFILIRIMEPEASFCKDLLLFILLFIVNQLWTAVFCRFFKHEESLMCWSLMLLTASFVILPVVWDFAAYLHAISYFACFMPGGLYIFLLRL